MMRWALLLILLTSVLASALGVIMLRHEARLLFVALEATASARDAEQVEWSRLQLEQAWLADAGRIEGQATSRLGMSKPGRVGVLVSRP